MITPRARLRVAREVCVLEEAGSGRRRCPLPFGRTSELWPRWDLYRSSPGYFYWIGKACRLVAYRIGRGVALSWGVYVHRSAATSEAAPRLLSLGMVCRRLQRLFSLSSVLTALFFRFGG